MALLRDEAGLEPVGEQARKMGAGEQRFFLEKRLHLKSQNLTYAHMFSEADLAKKSPGGQGFYGSSFRELSSSCGGESEDAAVIATTIITCIFRIGNRLI